MTKPRKTLSPRVHKLLDKLFDLFDVRSFDVGLTIVGSDEPTTDGTRGAAATIDINEEYRRFVLTFYPCFFEAPLAKQREYLLHEFCHLTTAPMLSLLDDFKNGRLVTPQQIRVASEQATSQTAQILDGFLTGGWREKRQAYQQFIKKPKKPQKLRKRQRV